MGESLITMAVVGLIAGFIFSMPIAGPISFLVTSNALKGRIHYCNRVAIGASFADFVYVFIAIYGVTKLYSFYKPAIPYILLAGALFIIYVGYRIFRSKVDLEHLDEINPKTGKPFPKGRGGFYTGFMVNFLNPTLIIGWLTTSVLVISFISSLGFDTGGLDSMIDQNVKTLNIEGQVIEKSDVRTYIKPDTLKFFKNHQPAEPVSRPAYFTAEISLVYAFSLAVGSILWFMLLTLALSRFRRWINLHILTGMVRAMGIVLCLFGCFFIYTAIKMLC
ncbi:MAG: LysE family transporter [Bacteroidota bacterium]